MITMITQNYPSHTSLSKRAIEILYLLAEGMSDREIAERLVVTVNTVKWYNRQIYSTLNVGSRTEAVAHAHKLQLLDNSHLLPPGLQFVRHISKHHLPVKPTSFIGRGSELRVIKGLLNQARLVTLVGAPGVGKTRLALQAASEIADSFHEGAYFVSLESIRDPALVITAIAHRLGVSELHGEPLIETVKRFLHTRQLLLVLDNFEHLRSAAIQVSELLSASAQLKVLVTGRTPIHIYGEHEYAVSPLSLPHLSQIDLHTLASYEAIALFIRRAQSVRADFQVTEDNALEIAQICAHLDGVPLAIELAAARLKMLSPRSLLAHLKTSTLDTLNSGICDLPVRQQTMRNAIEWSYELLDGPEKILFMRLAVIQQPCSMEEILRVGGDELSIEVSRGLISLVDQCLIERTEASEHEPRFYMLEMIREYARERLNESYDTEMNDQRPVEHLPNLQLTY